MTPEETQEIEIDESEIVEKDGKFFDKEGRELELIEESEKEDDVEDVKDDADEKDSDEIEDELDDDEDDDDDGLDEIEEEIKDEESPIIDIEEGEEDNEDDDDADIDDASSEEISTAMRKTETYRDYFDSAKEKGKTVDDDFAAGIARNRIPPDFLAENEIYSYDDMVDVIQDLKQKVDPERITIPSEHAPREEIDSFMEDHFGVPKSVEGYDAEKLFLDTEFEGDSDEADEVRTQLVRDAYELGLSNDQARGMIEMFSDEKKQHRETQEKEMKEYVQNTKNTLKEIYGEDHKAVTREVSQIISKFGVDFYNEFKGDKVLSSASLIKFIGDLTHGLSKGEELPRMGIGSLSTSQLEERVDRLLKSKYMSREYADHEDPKIRKQHKKLNRRYEQLYTELERRNSSQGI